MNTQQLGPLFQLGEHVVIPGVGSAKQGRIVQVASTPGALGKPVEFVYMVELVGPVHFGKMSYPEGVLQLLGVFGEVRTQMRAIR